MNEGNMECGAKVRETCIVTMNRSGLLPLLHWRRGPGRRGPFGIWLLELFWDLGFGIWSFPQAGSWEAGRDT